MASDEALLQILTHVKTTACETIEITSCEEAMRFLKAWESFAHEPTPRSRYQDAEGSVWTTAGGHG